MVLIFSSTLWLNGVTAYLQCTVLVQFLQYESPGSAGIVLFLPRADNELGRGAEYFRVAGFHGMNQRLEKHVFGKVALARDDDRLGVQDTRQVRYSLTENRACAGEYSLQYRLAVFCGLDDIFQDDLIGVWRLPEAGLCGFLRVFKDGVGRGHGFEAAFHTASACGFSGISPDVTELSGYSLPTSHQGSIDIQAQAYPVFQGGHEKVVDVACRAEPVFIDGQSVGAIFDEGLEPRAFFHEILEGNIGPVESLVEAGVEMDHASV